jgi:diguanylate cyclase (GGDEF)-like protein
MQTMSTPQHAAAPAGIPTNFTWFSNPLDWRPIDRLILLGGLTMLVPVLVALALVLGMVVTPSYLNFSLAWPMLALYVVHGAVLGGFLAAALRRRQHSDDWPAFENVIIVSFVVGVLVGAYLTGTHFAEGLLIVFLGINITSALANIRKIRRAYFVVCALMLAFAVIDLYHALPAAPLFVKPIMHADNSLTLGWLIARILLAGILLAISAISMAAINRWVEREDLYREMSTVDGLTRLANRRFFLERGNSELSRAQRFGSSPVACIMVDLDHFKRINDTFGHHAGDQVLVAASSIMMQSARQYDEVGRYGGEEFAMLLPGATLEVAAQVAERIREKIAYTPVEVDGRLINMSASFGVACYPGPGIKDLNDLLKSADKALYVAKASGRNRVCVDKLDE